MLAKTKRMRVLYLANAAHIGGGNRVLLQLWAGVVSRGVDPFVVLPTHGPMEDECAKLDLPYRVVPYIQPSWHAPVASWLAMRAWRRLLLEIGPQVVHANDPFTARIISLASRLEKVPLVCHVHFPPGTRAMAWLFRFLPKPATFVFCSRALQEEVGLSLRRCFPNSQQLAIQNCIPLDAFNPTPIAHGPVNRVGIVANLLPVKGHLDFLSMVAELTARGVEAEYLIIGDDIHQTGYKAVLENRVRELGLSTRVRFLGHRRNVRDILQQLDIVVCTSHIEPFGMCVLEALACARPVVATRVGGIPEIVEDGLNGFLVPPHAPAQLANAVERLLRDSDLRREFGRSGRLRAERHFNQNVYVEKILTVYHQATRVHVCG